MSVKASILKGTRDFGPAVVRQRAYILKVIKEVFELYGFQPIETPAMEKLETLTGKYGEEGDQLLFKVLNNGHFLDKVEAVSLEQKDSKAVAFQISKRGLRYDLTVPFARYVAMHQNELVFPFKRYQIQTVWRGDRPQKGRYQEFVQCDADVIGTDSLWADAEFMMILDQVFSRLGLEVTIHLNNRKILQGLAEAYGMQDQLSEFTTVIDKWDKIGPDKVRDLMTYWNLSPAHIDSLLGLLDAGTLEVIDASDLPANTHLEAGISELQEVLQKLTSYNFVNTLKVDTRLARGLSYYTGSIVEVTATGESIGSIAGGGRYDDLTGIFGLTGTSGMGISFGLARIYDVLQSQDLFPEAIHRDLDILFLAMDEASLEWSYSLAADLRQRGMRVDLYPEVGKFKKLMKYADRRSVRHVAIIGEQERSEGLLTVKDMHSGDQYRVSLGDLQVLLTGI